MAEYINTYIPDIYFEKNEFVKAHSESGEKPCFQKIKDRLPEPVWDENPDALKSYYKAWKIAFGNIKKPTKKNGFVAPYIDAAFNGHMFLWDSCFMLMFGKYARPVFDFQKTLDNFYCKQEKDGFFGREIDEKTGESCFFRHDPTSTGPEIPAWCEWEYYKASGDKERLLKVFYPLLSYHRWFKAYRRHPDGSYWSTGWGCGMDNLPRTDKDTLPGADPDPMGVCHHSFMSWIDATSQAALSCEILLKAAKELNINDDVKELEDERAFLLDFINKKMWSEHDGFYYDLKSSGELLKVKTAASFWTLLSGAAPKERVKELCRHLEDENEFKRTNRVPALSADHPDFDPRGDYWNGGVWAPVVYMVVQGLKKNGCYELAREIAVCCYENMLKVFKDTGTFWENYAPDFSERGERSGGDFVGWTGIIPITMLIEDVFGIETDAENNEIVWRVNELSRHGVKNLPFGKNGSVTLICEKRSSKTEKPQITVMGDRPKTVRVIFDGGEFCC